MKYHFLDSETQEKKIGMMNLTKEEILERIEKALDNLKQNKAKKNKQYSMMVWV